MRRKSDKPIPTTVVQGRTTHQSIPNQTKPYQIKTKPSNTSLRHTAPPRCTISPQPPRIRRSFTAQHHSNTTTAPHPSLPNTTGVKSLRHNHCTTSAQPLHNLCTTASQPLHNLDTTAQQPLHNRATTALQPLHSHCTTTPQMHSNRTENHVSARNSSRGLKSRSTGHAWDTRIGEREAAPYCGDLEKVGTTTDNQIVQHTPNR
jgi:hypothetical protein